MINMQKYRHQQRGFSLTEFAIVLGVIGTVMGAIWGYASIAYENVKREKAFEQITAVVTNMRTTYGGRSGLPNAAKTVLIPQLINGGTSVNATNLGIVPQDMVRQPNTTCTGNSIAVCADSPWGSKSGGVLNTSGTFQICNWDIDPTANAGNQCDAGNPTGQIFAVALFGLPIGACIQLASKVSSPLGPPGLLDVIINTRSIIYNRTLPGAGVLPVSSADTTTLCTQANNGNIIKFVYRLRLPQS